MQFTQGKLQQIVIHVCFLTVDFDRLIACIVSCTVARWKYGQLWFFRSQQGKIRLNATVIAMMYVRNERLLVAILTGLFRLAAIYSAMAIAYSALMLYQQELGRYVPGSAGFELSWSVRHMFQMPSNLTRRRLCSFAAVSACVSVIIYCYYESLPAGIIEHSYFRRLLGWKHAATDTRLFGLSFLGVWQVLSIAGTMVAPLIHDYWRQQADDTIASLIAALSQTAAQQKGLVSLLSLQSEVELLFLQLDRSVQALRWQCLVYLGHAALFFCTLTPIAWKLISLLNNQIFSLHRAADDFFRMGSRLDPAKSKVDLSQPAAQAQLHTRTARKPIPTALSDPIMAHALPDATARSDIVVAVDLNGGNKETEKEDGAKQRPIILAPLTIAPGPDPQPIKRLQPRFARPNLPLHSEFPLVRAKKLAKIRLELSVFSTLLTSAMAAFLAACAILYKAIPNWSAADITIACYTVFLWNFAIPAMIACGLYVYMTLSLPRTGSSVASTPTSKSSTQAPERLNVKTLVNKLTSVGKIEKHEMLPVSIDIGFERSQVAFTTRRTQPTYPRAASVTSLGMTTEAGRTERADRDTDSESVFVPPVPTIPLSRSGSRIKKWVKEDSRTAESLAVPVPSLPPAAATAMSPTRLATKKRSMGPVSQTQSWLDIDEE